MKAYPEYNKVNLPWLDRIPAGWSIERSKNIFKSIDIRSKTGQEELLSVSEKHGVTPRKNINVTMFQAESYEGYKMCWPGDLVINSLWAWMQGLGFSRHHGIISSAYGVYRLKNEYADDYKYFDYLIRSKAYLWELRVNSKGIWRSRYQLTDESFFTIPIIIPDKKERIHISRFLDYKTYQINKFIRAKKRMIELLKEQKQCIINDAVTGKIDVRTGKPYPKYKDSGVEWLGQVPEGWEVRKLKHISKMKSGDNITSLFIEEKGTYPVYGGNGIRGYCSDFTHDGEYVLIGRQGALCGNVHYVSERFWASEHAVVTKAIVSCSMMWLYYLLSVMNLNQYSESAAQPGISVEKIQNLRTIYPCYKEQVFINKYIDDRTKRITTTITNDEREISLMQEYRTRLIADVVTGKVDVRGVEVPDVPEEVEMLEGNRDEEGMAEELDSVEEAENE